MKKTAKNLNLKKLTLNRETLRNLSEKETHQAVGGEVTVSCTAESVCHWHSCYC
ncbi:MAG: class I lanthipeptide [Acidobacteriota bacterium]